MTDFANNWRNLSGENLWNGLLEPLNVDLRRYIIHYGERAGAIDDVFIGDDLISPPKSEFVGLPRYPRASLFKNVGLVNGNPYKYLVKKYVYGVPKLAASHTSNLLAYVAVSTHEGSKALGRRDILIAWRGTKLVLEGAVDNATRLRSAPEILGHGNAAAKVHAGWCDYYTNVDAGSPKNKTTSCRDQVLDAVKELIHEYIDDIPKLSITITGRGTGAAFAILNAMDIICKPLNYPRGQPGNACLVTAIVFGCPRLGNQAFASLICRQKMLQILRVTNEQDPMPKFPPAEEYIHFGIELKINTVNSPYLKNPKTTVQELEVYLHGVAGQQGINSKKFEWEGVRDKVLVNKILDGLKDEYEVTPKWGLNTPVPLNEFMVQDDSGAWELKDDSEEDEE